MARAGIGVDIVEIARMESVLNGRALEIAQDLGIVEVAISLSFTNDVAVANAMTITEDARPKQKPDRESEKARIARSFREAKSVLEELERVQDAELVSISGESQITE